jgi:hypothetical protein
MNCRSCARLFVRDCGLVFLYFSLFYFRTIGSILHVERGTKPTCVALHVVASRCDDDVDFVEKTLQIRRIDRMLINPLLILCHSHSKNFQLILMKLIISS